MMRAMAICYVGPAAKPDLSTNYYISPILTPDHILARFPPVSIICGERDPLADDSIIFTGKIREAKLRRQAEARVAQYKQPEGLRMSASSPNRRDPILDENEDDWIETRFVSGWSHGFLQMLQLIPEVEGYINAMGDWISTAFQRNAGSTSPLARKSQTAGPILSSTSSSTTPTRQTQPQSQIGNSKANGKSSRLERTGSDSSGTSEGTVLTFTPRRRGNTLTANAPVDSSSSPIKHRPAATLKDIGRTASNDETTSTVRRGLTLPLQAEEAAARRGSDSKLSGKSAVFMDDRELLKRRREEAVYGMGASLSLPNSSDEDAGEADEEQPDQS